MNNILITSVGRRFELVMLWKASAQNLLGSDVKVFATDLAPELSPACHAADQCFEIVRCTDPSYPLLLLELCIEHNVKLVVPTIDTELLILSESLNLFESAGIKVVISSSEFIRDCRDKRRTAELFNSLSVNTPLIFDVGDLRYPCFMKPIGGSCSQGVKAIYSSADLCQNDISSSENIFQQLIPGDWIEYTVDLYYSFSSNLIGCVPRQRIEARGGEISKGIVRKDGVFSFVRHHFSFLEGARGPITLQLFTDSSRENFLAIEINPRFGGGYPMSHAAGVDYPGILIRELLFGENPVFIQSYKPDVLMLRHDAMISLDKASATLFQ